MPSRGRGRRRGRGQAVAPTTDGTRRRGSPPAASIGTEATAERNTRTSEGGLRGHDGDGNGRGAPDGREPLTPAAPPEASPAVSPGSIDSTVTKRPGFGTLGTPVDVIVNCFRSNIPDDMIYHYEVSILPVDRLLPPKLNTMIIHQMQHQHSFIFTRRGAYDGRRNLYSPVRYALGDESLFSVNEPIRPGRWRVRIKFAGIMNPLSATQYIEGRKESHDNSSLMTVNVCNIAIRMGRFPTHPSSRRFFFSRAEHMDIGGEIELWRGYFQSFRPTIGNMLINVDISAVALYKSGPLVKLCMELLGHNPDADPVPFLSGQQLDAQTRHDLLRRIRNLNVEIGRPGLKIIRAIRGISENGADVLMFGRGGLMAEGIELQTLQYPTLVCVQVQVGQAIWVPLERCEVIPEQFYRETLTPEHARNIVEFTKLRPDVRLQTIRNSLQVLGYSNNTCLQEFGINVDPNPLTIRGRILPTPTLMTGGNATIQPRDGRWDMRGKTLYKPETVLGCAVIIYDEGFEAAEELHLKQRLFDVSRLLGIQGIPSDPPVLRRNARAGAYWNHLREAATLHNRVKGNLPNLIIVVLPDVGSDHIYLGIKNAGDIRIGVATQCLKSSKCGNASEEYFFNVCLKINAKLGGINVTLKPETIPFSTDRAIPTIVMGARVSHPGPYHPSWPSSAAVVGSVDPGFGKYIAVSRAQSCHAEIIEDLTDTVSYVIRKYIQFQNDVQRSTDPVLQRILFYRAGISESQFQQLRDSEVPQIFRACDRIGIPRPKLTFIVVGKCHHIRFFPPPNGRSDGSGNVPAGLVIDREITSPVEYDFYLQSHAGTNGTSRSAHYSVLIDQNNFTPDDLQRISFSLCHLNAGSMRSTSIVSPVRFAEMVSERAKVHYDPNGWNEAPMDAGAHQREVLRHVYQPVHPNIGQHMYFI